MAETCDAFGRERAGKTSPDRGDQPAARGAQGAQTHGAAAQGNRTRRKPDEAGARGRTAPSANRGIIILNATFSVVLRSVCGEALR